MCVLKNFGMIEGVRKIGFDADDTLWVNETYFRETEQAFYELVGSYVDEKTAEKELFQTEMQNMSLYGYGVKAFILSVIETTIRITGGKIPVDVIAEIICLGKKQLSHAVELLDGVDETLNALAGRYELILVTKGDLLDQEHKLADSGLEHFFHHVEVVTDKTEYEYSKLLKHINVLPEEFLMVGNSMRSDVLPPLALGCYAIHVPSQIIWLHEHIEAPVAHPHFHAVNTIRDIMPLLL